MTPSNREDNNPDAGRQQYCGPDPSYTATDPSPATLAPKSTCAAISLPILGVDPDRSKGIDLFRQEDLTGHAYTQPSALLDDTPGVYGLLRHRSQTLIDMTADEESSDRRDTDNPEAVRWGDHFYYPLHTIIANELELTRYPEVYEELCERSRTRNAKRNLPARFSKY
jgi:hypothetical protein